MAGELKGLTALVTGASRGVGRGIAIGLAEAGANVVVAARTLTPNDAPLASPGGPRLPGSLAETVATISSLGGRAEAVRCDLVDPRSIDALVAEAVARFGRIDLLVNNALPAGRVAGPLDAIGADEWDALMTVGVRGAYLVSRVAAVVMKNEGMIVNVSSACSALEGYSTAFGVMCAAIDRLTQGLAAELAGAGISVMSLWPNLVRTERVEMEQAGKPTGTGLAAPMDLDAIADPPELVGRALARLAADPGRDRYSGRVVTVSDLAERYGVTGNGGRPARTSERIAQLREERRSLTPAVYNQSDS